MKVKGTTLNSKQKAILEFILNSIEYDQHCPTVREICEEVGLSSTSTVQSHLNKLIELGYLERIDNKSRALKITDLARRINKGLNDDTEHTATNRRNDFEFLGQHIRPIPLVGAVQAGMPITAVENRESELMLPVTLTGNSDCFLLRVQGESMMNAGIYEGDMLIVRNQATANNGDIVVARIDDEATVKRFYKEKDHIRLQPENDSFEPIIVKDCTIEGKVIGLIREDI